jgi:sigma-B regulation protein RsbU (phosphoserine phosphatase)
MVKSSIRCWAYHCDNPSDALTQLNETLVRDFDDETFATVFVGILDCANKTFTYSNAGHSPAIWWNASSKLATLMPPTGLLVGQFPGAVYEEHQIVLSEEDEILLATDGLYELWRQGELLGIDGLMRLYTEMKLSTEQSASGLVERVVNFCESELRDDLAILRITASPTP